MSTDLRYTATPAVRRTFAHAHGMWSAANDVSAHLPMDDQVPESDKPLPISFWSKPVPANMEPERSMLSDTEKKHASDLELVDWMPTFRSRGLNEEDVILLQGTFSQFLNKNLRTYEQIYEHICMVQIAMQKQPQADIDPIWVAQHEAFTPKQFVAPATNVPLEEAQDNPASGSVAQDVQTDSSAQQTKAKGLPSPEMQAKREAVAVAKEVWRKAVADRKAAMAQWDAYVRWTHDEVRRIRDS